MTYVTQLMRNTGVRFSVDVGRVQGRPSAPHGSPQPDVEDVREIRTHGTGAAQVDAFDRDPRGRPADAQDRLDQPLSAKGESRDPENVVAPAGRLLEAYPAPAAKARQSMEQATTQIPEASSRPHPSLLVASGWNGSALEPSVSDEPEALQLADSTLPAAAFESALVSRPAWPEVVAWVARGSSLPDDGSAGIFQGQEDVSALKDHAIVEAPALHTGQLDNLQTEEAQMLSLHIGTIQLTVEDPVTPRLHSSAPQSREAGWQPASKRPSRLSRHYLRW